MENFLLNNRKTNIRYKDNEIEVYEPNQEQYQELVKIIQDSSKIDNNLGIEANINMEYLRYIFKNLTSLGDLIDSMSDEEILDALDNGNRRIVILYREIEKLINEILEDIRYNSEQQIKMTSSFINILNSNESRQKLEEKINRLFKKYNVNLSLEELNELRILSENKYNPKRLEELLNKVNQKSKKINRKKK